MSENKKIPESKPLTDEQLADDKLDAVVGGGEASDSSVCCVCIIGGDGNW